MFGVIVFCLEKVVLNYNFVVFKPNGGKCTIVLGKIGNSEVIVN